MDRSPAWAEVQDDEPGNDDEGPGTDGTDDEPDDGRPADKAHVKTWAAYARSLGIDVQPGTSRPDIIAAVDAAAAADAAAEEAEKAAE